MLVIGISRRIQRKYGIDISWLLMMNGCSTGCPSILVSVSRSAASHQNRTLTERLAYYVLFF